MDILSEVSDLSQVVNPESTTKGDWMSVPEDLAEKTVSFWSDYYASNVDSRPRYDPVNDLFLDGGRGLLPKLRSGDMDNLHVTALADGKGNVTKMKIKLEGADESLYISGKALESTARFYFQEKAESKS